MQFGNLTIDEDYEYQKTTQGGITYESGRINKYTSSVNGNSTEYEYAYDANGRIILVRKNGTYIVRYQYDDLGRLVREDNLEADKTWVILYDNAGNILRKREYPYTTATYPAGEPAYYLNNYNRDRISSVYYHHEWSTGDGDFVNTQTYDSLGNPLSYKNLKGVYNYNFTWINGRQLASATTQFATSSYTYDADGYRLTRIVNGVEYKYIWVDGLLMSQTWGSEIMVFFYDEVGSPIGFGYRYGSGDGYDYYYYEKNLQGDIVGIFDQGGTRIVEYTYDAWGESQGMSGPGAYPLGFNNPFRYRGYYFDYETNLYYLQSRYYDPVNGSFLNPDGEMSGVGTYEGYNLYSYCFNDPVNMSDPTGCWPSWGQVFQAAAIVAVATVAVVAVVATAGAAGAAIGAAAGVYLGASATTCAAVATIATVGAYTVAAGIGACALSEAGEVLTGTNVIRDKVMGGNQEAYDTVRTLLNIAGMCVVQTGANYPSPNKQSDLEKYAKNPEKIKNVEPTKIKGIAIRENLNYGTLSKGSHAGQGFKVTWGGDRLLQYHPGGGHHGEKSYWKVSSGEFGTIRIFNDR